jgi:hypothetical protein
MPHTASSVRYGILCGFVLLVSLAPILLNTHPPLIDYPMYIARIFILSELNSNPFVSEHYSVSSFLIPNISTELIAAPLVAFVSHEVVFTIFLSLICVLIFMGTIYLNHTLFKRRSLWPLIAGLFVINWILLFGFLSYTLGVGIFLWGFAAWVRLSRQQTSIQVLCGTVIATVLFFTHLAAFGLYVVAVAGFEAQRALTFFTAPNRTSIVSVARTTLSAVVQFMPAIVLFALSPTSAAVLTDHGFMTDPGFSGIRYNLYQKMYAPLVTLTSGNPWIDVSTGTVLIVLVVLIAFFGRVTIAKSLIGAFAALMIAFLMLPVRMGNQSYIDARIPIAILFVLIAGVRVSFKRRFAAGLATVLLAGLVVAKSVVLVQDWQRHDELIGEYLAAFGQLPKESTLFVAAQQAPRAWTTNHYVWRMQSPTHVADLATLTGSVFVPAVFASPGQHTIEVREKFRDLWRYQGSDPIEISDGQGLAKVVEDVVALHRQVSPDRAAYLLLLDRLEPPIMIPEDLSLIASGKGFRLMEIDAPAD